MDATHALWEMLYMVVYKHEAFHFAAHMNHLQGSTDIFGVDKLLFWGETASWYAYNRKAYNCNISLYLHSPMKHKQPPTFNMQIDILPKTTCHKYV